MHHQSRNSVHLVAGSAVILLDLSMMEEQGFQQVAHLVVRMAEGMMAGMLEAAFYNHPMTAGKEYFPLTSCRAGFGNHLYPLLRDSTQYLVMRDRLHLNLQRTTTFQSAQSVVLQGLALARIRLRTLRDLPLLLV